MQEHDDVESLLSMEAVALANKLAGKAQLSYPSSNGRNQIGHVFRFIPNNPRAATITLRPINGFLIDVFVNDVLFEISIRNPSSAEGVRRAIELCDAVIAGRYREERVSSGKKLHLTGEILLPTGALESCAGSFSFNPFAKRNVVKIQYEAY